ncbi:uncharacterized protein LOC115996407 [Ipomoea triloba]|uniref:uncharacterized protein LOC115996407 n=1 Tax=Ipomoea triloba TaxID=35885 RepID=UPI00125D3892|nr:uncharacterized protein LOC115996407 [Ipomoea triloba]
MELLAAKINSAAAILLLLLLVAAAPWPRATAAGVDSLVYDIDYRGPETHSNNIPPPNRGGGRHNFRRRPIAAARHKSKGVRASKGGRNGKKK